MEENHVTEKVYCYPNDNNQALLGALLGKENNGMTMAALLNGAKDNQWDNPFVYLVWMMFAQRLWGNQNDNGQNAQNIELQNPVFEISDL